MTGDEDDYEGHARTAEALRDQFVESCRDLVDYWANSNPKTMTEYTVHDRLSGALHSFLCLIDGVSSQFPCALDLVCAPHPDDKAFHIAEGDDWVEPGTVINASDMLHELLYTGRWAPKP